MESIEQHHPLQDNLEQFLNETIIGQREMKTVLRDLKLLQRSPGSITDKLKAVRKINTDKKIRASITAFINNDKETTSDQNGETMPLLEDITKVYIRAVRKEIKKKLNLSKY